MGVWAHTPFGNDDAADWLRDIRDSGAMGVEVQAAIEAYLAPDGVIDEHELREAKEELLEYFRGQREGTRVWKDDQGNTYETEEALGEYAECLVREEFASQAKGNVWIALAGCEVLASSLAEPSESFLDWYGPVDAAVLAGIEGGERAARAKLVPKALAAVARMRQDSRLGTPLDPAWTELLKQLEDRLGTIRIGWRWW
jgi:hypothetical protein